MAEAQGAVVTGHNRASTLLTPNFSRDFEPYTPSWLTFIDRRGNRFIDETLDYTVVPGAVAALPEQECFAIFDEEARVAAKQHIASTDAKKIYDYSSWSGEALARMAHEGRIFVGATLRELAQRADIHAGGLETTAALLNADVARGTDTHFLKPASQLRPLRHPPFYAVRLRPSVIGTTHAGLRCDGQSHVLGQDGAPVAGLFAAGETVGNVLGERYVGGGNAIANAITFGRIAGKAAANEALALAGVRHPGT
jgi:fumarate reductase flavoprotein subunit